MECTNISMLCGRVGQNHGSSQGKRHLRAWFIVETERRRAFELGDGSTGWKTTKDFILVAAYGSLAYAVLKDVSPGKIVSVSGFNHSFVKTDANGVRGGLMFEIVAESIMIMGGPKTPLSHVGAAPPVEHPSEPEEEEYVQ